MSVDFNRPYLFGPFRLDPRQRELRRGDVPVRLTPKAADLLFVLVERHGEIVAKDELIKAVWPDTFVTDNSLTFHLHLARQALGDSAANPTYIETVAKRGYRFICPVTRTEIGNSHDRRTVPARRPRLVRVAAAALVLGTALMAVAWTIDTRRPASVRVTRSTQLTHDGAPKNLLIAMDAETLLFSGTDGLQYALNVRDGRVTRTDLLAEYYVFDVSPVRGEALALRPNDRGAEWALWAVPIDGRPARRLSMVKVTGDAAWSNDGQQVAYLHGHQVAVTDAAAGPMRVLATFTGSPQRVRWSPDDRFLRVDVGAASDRTTTIAQYDVSLDGGEPVPVAPLPPADLVCCGSWMPGSDDYVFQTGMGWRRQLWMRQAGGGLINRRPPQLHPLDPPSGGSRYLYPVPSADGTTVYAIGVSEYRLSVFDQQRGTLLPYLGGIEAFAVRASPDGRSIVYIKPSDLTLWRARADGSQPRQLTGAPWHVDAVEWSPDGRRLAIRARTSGNRTKVYLLNADGGVPEPLTAGDVEQGSPTWSADGTRIAFGDVPEHYGHATGSERIHIYDLRTRETTDVDGSEGLWSSRWSPDGGYLAATRITDRMLMLYDFATNRWEPLGAGNVAELTWAPDSQSIYCEAEGTEHALRRVWIGTRRIEPVLKVRELTLYPGAGVAPDGRPLLLRAMTDIVALQLERR